MKMETITTRAATFEELTGRMFDMCKTILDVKAAPDYCPECGYEPGTEDAHGCWKCDPEGYADRMANYDGPSDEEQWSHTEEAYGLIHASREREKIARGVK